MALDNENAAEVKVVQKKKRKGRFTPYDVAFVQDNYTVMTDGELAEKLNRGKNSIMALRKKLSLSKSEISGQQRLDIIKKRAENPALEGISKYDKVKAAIR